MENTSLDEFVDADTSTEESESTGRVKTESTESEESEATESEQTEASESEKSTATRTEKTEATETEGSGSSETGAVAETDPSTDPDEVTPATIVSAWSGDGATCARCTESVQRLWMEDGQQVCGECKTWA